MAEEQKTKEEAKVFTYNEMLELYLNKKLYWAHQTTYRLFDKITPTAALKQMIDLCNKRNPDELLYRAKVSHWLIFLNFEYENNNVKDHF